MSGAFEPRSSPRHDSKRKSSLLACKLAGRGQGVHLHDSVVHAAAGCGAVSNDGRLRAQVQWKVNGA